MNYDHRRGWAIHVGAPHPFNDKAPYVDNGVGRPDPRRYYDPAYAAAEWEKVWTRTWLLAAVSSDLKDPGDFVRFDVGPESFIVVRDDSGQARAHYNVCPHRGSRIALSDLGAVAKFTCPFHSWSFGLDGANLQVTDEETFRPEVLCHGKDLTSVRCEETAGFIFISMSDDVPPLRAWLGPVATAIDGYSVGDMHVVQHKRSEWAANWKGGVDAFYETYHLHAVHPQTQCMMDDRSQIDLYPNGMSRQFVPIGQPSPKFKDQSGLNEGLKLLLRDAGIDPDQFAGTAQDSRAAIQRAKRERAAAIGLDYSHFSDSQLTDSVVYGVFPNVQLGCHPEGVFVHRFLPHPVDPNRFFYDTMILFRHVDAPGYKAPDWMGLSPGTDTSGATRPELVRTGLGEPPGLGQVLDQDSDLLPIVQAGARSRGFKGPLWSEQENRLRHFHAELDRRMAAP